MEKKVLKKDDVKWIISVVVKKDCWAREQNNVYYCTVENKANVLINQRKGVDDGGELKFDHKKSWSSPCGLICGVWRQEGKWIKSNKKYLVKFIDKCGELLHLRMEYKADF